MWPNGLDLESVFAILRKRMMFSVICLQHADACQVLAEDDEEVLTKRKGSTTTEGPLIRLTRCIKARKVSRA